MSEEPVEVAAAASVRVFGTTELLEAILYELGTSNASHSYYHDGINKMRTLLLAQRVSKHWKAVIDDSSKVQQALFFRPLPGGSYTKEDALDKYDHICVNPLLPFRWELEEHQNSLKVWGGRINLKLMEESHTQSASWRRMLPTHPSIKHAFLSASALTGFKNVHQRIGLATMEEVIDELIRTSRECRLSGEFAPASVGLDLYLFRDHNCKSGKDERVLRGAPDLESMAAHAKLKEKKSREREAEM